MSNEALRTAAVEALEELKRVRPQNQSPFWFRVTKNLQDALDQQPAASGEPVAWVNGAALKSAAVSRERGGPYDLHTWSESRTTHHDTPLTAPAAQSAPRLKWMEAPRRTEWGAGMMETLIALSADETLQLYAHRDAVPLVDALLSAQPAPARVPLTTDALKPCPFCGSDGVEALDMEGKHYVVCYDCALEGPFHKSRAAVIAAWNTRAATLA